MLAIYPFHENIVDFYMEVNHDKKCYDTNKQRNKSETTTNFTLSPFCNEGPLLRLSKLSC